MHTCRKSNQGSVLTSSSLSKICSGALAAGDFSKTLVLGHAGRYRGFYKASLTSSKLCIGTLFNVKCPALFKVP